MFRHDCEYHFHFSALQVGNSGMFRPEMLQPMGLPEDVNVIAWGLGLERWASDHTYTPDLERLSAGDQAMTWHMLAQSYLHQCSWTIDCKVLRALAVKGSQPGRLGPHT